MRELLESLFRQKNRELRWLCVSSHYRGAKKAVKSSILDEESTNFGQPEVYIYQYTNEQLQSSALLEELCKYVHSGRQRWQSFVCRNSETASLFEGGPHLETTKLLIAV